MQNLYNRQADKNCIPAKNGLKPYWLLLFLYCTTVMSGRGLIKHSAFILLNQSFGGQFYFIFIRFRGQNKIKRDFWLKVKKID